MFEISAINLVIYSHFHFVTEQIWIVFYIESNFVQCGIVFLALGNLTCIVFSQQ